MDNILTFLNTTGKSFVGFSISMLIQSSVLIIVLLILDFLLRKKFRAVLLYCIWMLILVKLVLPTTLSLPTGLGYWFGDNLPGIITEKASIPEQAASIPQRIEPVSETIPSGIGITALALPSAGTSPEPAADTSAEFTLAASPASASLSWHGFAFLGWLAVMIAMVLLLIQRMFFVRGLLKQSKNPNDSMVDIFERCCKQMGVNRSVFLKLSPVAASPSVCGLFRPTILIPKNLPGKLKAEDLRSILLHELAHINRGDVWVSFVQTILQIVYFYNPLLWVANAIIRKVREQAVDEMVLVAMGEQAEDYPETLLNISRLTFSRPVLSLRLIGVIESKKALHRRIKIMLNRPVPKSAKIGIGGFTILLILGFILLPMAGGSRANENDVDKMPNPSVRLVVGPDTMTFEGQQVTWGQLPALLEKVTNPGNTVFKIAVSPKDMPLSRYDSAMSQASKLVKQFGFEYLSYIGQHKLGSKTAKKVSGIDITPADFDIRLDEKRGVCNLVVSIQNECGLAIPKFKLNFYRGDISDNLDEAGNVRGGWHEAGPIEPGKKWGERTGDFHLPDGQYDFSVFLDYENSIAEIDENNNRALLKVKIENGRIAKALVARPTSPKDLKTDVQVEIKGKYSVKLPDDVKVELVGICDWPKEGRRCWQPDGLKLPVEIYAAKWNQDPGVGQYGFMYKITGSDDLKMLASQGLPPGVVKRGYIARKGSIAERVIESDEPLVISDPPPSGDLTPAAAIRSARLVPPTSSMPACVSTPRSLRST